MFEKAVVRSAGVERQVDVGVLAETLLFYSSVHLVLDRGSLSSLLKELGPELVVQLLEFPGVSASYSKQGFAVLTTRQAGFVFDQLVCISLGAKDRVLIHAQDEIEEAVIRAVRSNFSASQKKKIAKRITDRVGIFRFGADFGSQELLKAARDDLGNEALSRSAATAVIGTMMPGYQVPSSFFFKLVSTSEGYLADTNLHELKIDEAFGTYVPSTHGSLSSAYILSNVLDARVDAFFAAQYLGELVTGPTRSALIRQRHFDFVRRRSQSEFDLRAFQELTLRSGAAVGDVIRQKRRDFHELLDLVERASKFKKWLSTSSMDERLLDAYFAEVRRESWIDKLPPKSFRFVAASGLAAIAESLAPSGAGIAAALGIGAADTFVLDKLLKGWKPSHFVEGDLAAFVK